jgi:SAM-dependent methyltransferase
MLKRIAHWLVANPTVYDWVQYLAGWEKVSRHLAPHLATLAGQSVLDVGAGTGNLARLLPPGTRYVWLDNDPTKLRGFNTKDIPGETILGDATRTGLADKSVDCAVCVALAHHISDVALPALFRELARVTRTRLILLDPVAHPTSRVSCWLWRFDRGGFPRLPAVLRDFVARDFEIEREELFTIYHHYLLLVARPKAAT